MFVAGGGNKSKSHSISVSFRRPNMDKYSHTHESVGLNYLFIPELQRLHCWRLGIEK